MSLAPEGTIEGLRREAFEVGQRLAVARQGLERLEQREERDRRLKRDAERAAVLAAELGYAPSPRALNPDEFRETTVRAELAALAAQPRSTFDPNSPEGRAEIARQQDQPIRSDGVRSHLSMRST